MVTEVEWCGFDFGQCLMDPSGLRNYPVVGDVCKELGEPELIDERIHRYRVLKEKYEGWKIMPDRPLPWTVCKGLAKTMQVT